MSGRIRTDESACENPTSRMKSVRNAGVQMRRLRRAIALMLCSALVLALPRAIVQTTGEVSLSVPFATYGAAMQVADALANPSGASASAHRFVNDMIAAPSRGVQGLFGYESVSVDELPDELAEEISLPTRIDNCHVDAKSRVIGYRTRAAPDEALANLRESMASAGWRASAAEGIAGMSFEKGDGALRWALATATQDDDGAYIVLRLVG